MTSNEVAAAIRVRSLLVLKRAAFKLCFFVVAASGQALIGYEFATTLATLALLTAILALMLGIAARESARAPYLTYLDEACWFLLLGQVAGRLL